MSSRYCRTTAKNGDVMYWSVSPSGKKTRVSKKTIAASSKKPQRCRTSKKKPTVKKFTISKENRELLKSHINKTIDDILEAHAGYDNESKMIAIAETFSFNTRGNCKDVGPDLEYLDFAWRSTDQYDIVHAKLCEVVKETIDERFPHMINAYVRYVNSSKRWASITGTPSFSFNPKQVKLIEDAVRRTVDEILESHPNNTLEENAELIAETFELDSLGNCSVGPNLEWLDISWAETDQYESAHDHICSIIRDTLNKNYPEFVYAYVNRL